MINHPNRKRKSAKRPLRRASSPAPKSAQPSLDRIIDTPQINDMIGLTNRVRAACEDLAEPICALGTAFVLLMKNGDFEPFVTTYVALSHLEMVRRATATRGLAVPGEFHQIVEAMQTVIIEHWDRTEEAVAAEGGDPDALEPHPLDANAKVDQDALDADAEIDEDAAFDDWMDSLAELDPENYYTIENPQGISVPTINRLSNAVSTFLRATGEFGSGPFVVREVDYQGFTGRMVLKIDDNEPD